MEELILTTPPANKPGREVCVKDSHERLDSGQTARCRQWGCQPNKGHRPDVRMNTLAFMAGSESVYMEECVYMCPCMCECTWQSGFPTQLWDESSWSIVPSLRELRYLVSYPFLKNHLLRQWSFRKQPEGVARHRQSQRNLCVRSQGESASAISFLTKE